MRRVLCLVLCAALASDYATAQESGASLVPLSRTNSPTKRLKLALVVTDKTRKSMAAMEKFHQSLSLMLGEISTDKPFRSVASALRANFDTVTSVDTVEQAKASGADLIGIWDMEVEAKTFLPFLNSAKIDTQIIFTTMDQSQIDIVQARASRKVTPIAHPLPQVFLATAKDFDANFNLALVNAPRLADFAASKFPGGADGAADTGSAPSVGPAREIHSDVDTPTYSLPENPDNVAVVIGIEKYSALPEALFAERDAASVREHLIAMGFAPRNVIFIAGQRAGRSAFEKYIEAWLPRHVTEKSSVFVYFSGHGAPDADTRQAYLVPWDGDAKFLKNTGYPIKRLYEKLGELKAKDVLLVMDSCFSGIGGRSVIEAGARPLVTQVDTGIGNIPKNLKVLSASAADEITGADEQQGHGLFTYYFLRALNDKHGRATAKELYVSLVPHVRDAARRQNRAQTPQLLQ